MAPIAPVRSLHGDRTASPYRTGGVGSRRLLCSARCDQAHIRGRLTCIEVLSVRMNSQCRVWSQCRVLDRHDTCRLGCYHESFRKSLVSKQWNARLRIGDVVDTHLVENEIARSRIPGSTEQCLCITQSRLEWNGSNETTRIYFFEFGSLSIFMRISLCGIFLRLDPSPLSYIWNEMRQSILFLQDCCQRSSDSGGGV